MDHVSSFLVSCRPLCPHRLNVINGWKRLPVDRLLPVMTWKVTNTYRKPVDAEPASLLLFRGLCDLEERYD